MKFSIITITFNSKKFLEQTIHSVISQDYSNLEYIIIDAGSTDGTLDIITKYASEDHRIKFVSEPDKGISDAMNKGIRLASGDVIAHLHSDDFYPDSSVLSAVKAVFDSADPFWVTGGMYFVDEAGEIIDEIKVRDYDYEVLVRGNIILHPSTFIASRAFAKTGMFNISLKYAMDYDLWLRLGALGNPVTIDRPISCFRVHTGSLSTIEAELASKEEWLIRKRFLGSDYLRIFYHYCRYLRSRHASARYFNKLLGTE